MSKQPEESLSALLDGECSPAELDALLAELEAEPLLKARWSRACAARDARSGVALRGDLDLVAGVMAAIAGDDSADARPSVVPLRRAEPVVEIRAQPRRRSLRWQPVAGIAAAASIAAVAVVGGRSLWSGSDAGSAGGRSYANESNSSRWASIDPAAARQLDSYLMEHSSSREAAGMGSSLSYARLAVRTADYRPDESR